jgi:hypothetical protein
MDFPVLSCTSFLYSSIGSRISSILCQVGITKLIILLSGRIGYYNRAHAIACCQRVFSEREYKYTGPCQLDNVLHLEKKDFFFQNQFVASNLKAPFHPGV